MITVIYFDFSFLSFFIWMYLMRLTAFEKSTINSYYLSCCVMSKNWTLWTLDTSFGILEFSLIVGIWNYCVMEGTVLASISVQNLFSTEWVHIENQFLYRIKGLRIFPIQNPKFFIIFNHFIVEKCAYIFDLRTCMKTENKHSNQWHIEYWTPNTEVSVLELHTAIPLSAMNALKFHSLEEKNLPQKLEPCRYEDLDTEIRISVFNIQKSSTLGILRATESNVICWHKI